MSDEFDDALDPVAAAAPPVSAATNGPVHWNGLGHR